MGNAAFATQMPGSDDAVGLWVKQYMTTPDDEYEFVGIITTLELYRKTVARSQLDWMKSEKVEQKNTREGKVHEQTICTCFDLFE